MIFAKVNSMIQTVTNEISSEPTTVALPISLFRYKFLSFGSNLSTMML